MREGKGERAFALCLLHFLSGGEGLRCKDCVLAIAVPVSPSPPPLPRRAAIPPRRLRSCVRTHTGTKAVHMAHKASKARAMDHVGTGEAPMARPWRAKLAERQTKPTWGRSAHDARRRNS